MPALRVRSRGARPRPRRRLPPGAPSVAARADRTARKAAAVAAERVAVRVHARHHASTARRARRRAHERDRAVVKVEELVSARDVVICCGSGGVGKTTTAAVLALEGARRGRKACVVTIDPAKRLADTLGLEALTNNATEIDRERWTCGDPNVVPGGQLFALMLDTKSTFDVLVRRNAENDEQADRILENRFYRNVSGALGGTQEYMAMEKLHELHDEGGFDLIVVDTPPTRHALDFLDAPRRLTRLLDNRIFRVLITPTRASLKIASAAVLPLL